MTRILKFALNIKGDSMAIKSFVLDTNVLLHDPDSMFAFKDNKN